MIALITTLIVLGIAIYLLKQKKKGVAFRFLIYLK